MVQVHMSTMDESTNINTKNTGIEVTQKRKMLGHKSGLAGNHGKSEILYKSMRRNKRRKVMESKRLEFCCIPQDILFFEILVRVPAEDVLKLKSVSKQWCNLISGNQFKNAHFQHQKSSSPKLIISDRAMDYASFDIKTMRYKKLLLNSLLNKKITVLDSLDGLVLFRLRYGRKLYICNPITRKLKLLLTIPARWEDEYYYYKLVFDTALRKYKVIGICYPAYYPSTCREIYKDYCVLVINRNEGRPPRRVPKNNLVWKKFENPSFLHERCVIFTPVIIDGVLYWIAYKTCTDAEISDAETGYYIQTLDIVKEEFMGRIKFPFQPDIMSRSKFSLSAEVSKGGFLSLTLTMVLNKECIEVWALLDLDDKMKKVWIKQHHINLLAEIRTIDESNKHRIGDCAIYVIMDNRNQKRNNLFLRMSSEFYSYNLEDRKLVNIDAEVFDRFKYVHSLFNWD